MVLAIGHVDSMSPLSELTATDEEEDPTVEYRITRQLRAPRNTQYSTQSLLTMLHTGEIDLDAEYQRDVVWLTDRQQGLIDSIMRNYYIPPILFSLVDGPEGNEIRRCVDGKQRLTSIQLFMDGQIPYVDPDTGVKYWYGTRGPNNKAKRNYLPPRLQASFANKQMACVEYDRLSDFEEREVFQRVQKAVALTTAERHQAMSSPPANFTRELVARYFRKKDLSFANAKHFTLKCHRDIEFDHVLRLLWMARELATRDIFSFPMADIMTQQKLEKWLADNSTPINESVKQLMIKTMDIYLAISLHPIYGLAFKGDTILSPVEFHAIGVLIMSKMDTFDSASIVTGIKKVRAAIHTFEARRFKKEVLEKSYTTISGLKSVGTGVAASKDPDLIVQLRLTPSQSHSSHSSMSPTARTVSKRKWEDDSDSDTPLYSKTPKITRSPLANQPPTTQTPPSSSSISHTLPKGLKFKKTSQDAQLISHQDAQSVSHQDAQPVSHQGTQSSTHQDVQSVIHQDVQSSTCQDAQPVSHRGATPVSCQHAQLSKHPSPPKLSVEIPGSTASGNSVPAVHPVSKPVEMVPKLTGKLTRIGALRNLATNVQNSSSGVNESMKKLNLTSPIDKAPNGTAGSPNGQSTFGAPLGLLSQGASRPSAPAKSQQKSLPLVQRISDPRRSIDRHSSFEEGEIIPTGPRGDRYSPRKFSGSGSNPPVGHRDSGWRPRRDPTWR